MTINDFTSHWRAPLHTVKLCSFILVNSIYLVTFQLFFVFVSYHTADSLGFPSGADAFSHVKVTHGEEKPIRPSDLLWRMENNWPGIASQFIVAVLICGHYILLRIFNGGKRGEAYTVEYSLTPPRRPTFAHTLTCFVCVIEFDASRALDWHICALLSLSWTALVSPFTSRYTVFLLFA